LEGKETRYLNAFQISRKEPNRAKEEKSLFLRYIIVR